MTTQNKIKQLRLAKSWSQEQLADIASLNVRTIQRVENGAEPSLETLSAIAAAFDVSVEVLNEDKEYKRSYLANEKIEHAKQQLKEEIKFYKKFLFFFVISILLVTINLTTRSSVFWFIYPVVTMAVFLILSWLKVFLIKDKIRYWKLKKLKKLVGE